MPKKYDWEFVRKVKFSSKSEFQRYHEYALQASIDKKNKTQ